MKTLKKISINTPFEFCDVVRKALGDASAGQVSGYSHCSFSIRGTGRSVPGNGTKPFLGDLDKLEVIEEEKIETFCKEKDLLKVISAVKKVHPYEEPVVTVQDIQIY